MTLAGTEAIFFDLGDTLVTSGAWSPGAREILEALAQTELRTGIMSNTGDLSRDALLDLLPPDFSFDAFTPELVMLSSEVGIEKPDLRIFLEAVRRAAVSPWRCLFVGESLMETLAAQAAGMRGVRLAEPAKDFPVLVQQLTG